MVQQGDFTVSLVEATSKAPFKEHYHNAHVYVEVEPDIEYFISIQKTGTSRQHPTVLKIFVDDVDLNYQVNHHSAGHSSSKPKFCGLRFMDGVTRTHKALKFERPRVSSGKNASSPFQLMGTVKIEVYEGRSPRELRRPEGSSKKRSLSSSIDESIAGSLQDKKVLRSCEGDVSLSKRAKSGTHLAYNKLILVDTITLKYCAAVGLILAGVLPKPTDIYENYRLVKKFTDTPRGGASDEKPDCICIDLDDEEIVADTSDKDE